MYVEWGEVFGHNSVRNRIASNIHQIKLFTDDVFTDDMLRNRESPP